MNHQMQADQDDCLIKMEEGKAPPTKKLRALPPWRAVMIARIAEHMGVMKAEDVRALEAEAREVGGAGKLKND